MRKRFDTREFIEKSKAIHGDRYDYSLAEYKNSHSYVTIICREHGPFKTQAYTHYNGHHCPKCAGNQKLDKESFIKKAKNIWGNTYRFDNINFTGMFDDIEIFCNIHKETFYKLPKSILNGHGCPKCIQDASIGRRIKPFEEFLEGALRKHGKKYKYHKDGYINCHTKTRIECKIHGDFYQSPTSHLVGYGCPQCGESRGELLISKILRNLDIEFGRQVPFPGCIFKKPLKFDFSFRINSKVFVIEYQGEQHFTPVDFTSKMSQDDIKDSFSKTIIRDKIKKSYCFEHNIYFIEIPYWDIDDSYNIIINSIINGLFLSEDGYI
jgi:hypothetical protein